MSAGILQLLTRIAGRFLPAFGREKASGNRPSDRGILAFAHTSQVIAAERILKKEGIPVEVKGPPPELQTGCDMVIVFPLMRQTAVEQILKAASLEPELIQANTLLDPVDLYQVKDFGQWRMVRAANMKITVDKQSGMIVNISGGGCPDVPWLAQELTGKIIWEAPEPAEMGQTLCCYSLQKAFEELKRSISCG